MTRFTFYFSTHLPPSFEPVKFDKLPTSQFPSSHMPTSNSLSHSISHIITAKLKLSFLLCMEFSGLSVLVNFHVLGLIQDQAWSWSWRLKLNNQVKNIWELISIVFWEFMIIWNKPIERSYLIHIITVWGNTRLAPIHTNKFYNKFQYLQNHITIQRYQSHFLKQKFLCWQFRCVSIESFNMSK